MEDTPDYLAWCRNKGYKNEENVLDAIFALLFWPFAAFMPNPDMIRHRQYNMDIRQGRWQYGQIQ